MEISSDADSFGRSGWSCPLLTGVLLGQLKNFGPFLDRPTKGWKKFNRQQVFHNNQWVVSKGYKSSHPSRGTVVANHPVSRAHDVPIWPWRQRETTCVFATHETIFWKHGETIGFGSQKLAYLFTWVDAKHWRWSVLGKAWLRITGLQGFDMSSHPEVAPKSTSSWWTNPMSHT